MKKSQNRKELQGLQRSHLEHADATDVCVSESDGFVFRKKNPHPVHLDSFYSIISDMGTVNRHMSILWEGEEKEEEEDKSKLKEE